MANVAFMFPALLSGQAEQKPLSDFSPSHEFSLGGATLTIEIRDSAYPH